MRLSMPGIPARNDRQPRQVPLLWFVLLMILSAGFLAWIVVSTFQRSRVHENTRQVRKPAPPVRSIIRMDYALVRPVIYSEPADESPEFGQLKMQILELLNERKSSGRLVSAGIFLRELDSGRWMALGGEESYQAGSLLKVPIMITWLKMAETNPKVLDKKLFFPQPKGTIPGQTFGGRTITPDRYYTVSELLEYMIGESDNNATWVLGQNMDVSRFQKLFTDLGLSRPELNEGRYRLSAPQYSRFMDVLYHATVLDPASSEHALRLLTRCTFSKGLTRSLPDNILTAHKFGEQGIDGIAELSESGIVFDTKGNYLLTVMTKGADIDQMADIISLISRKVYDFMHQRGL